MPAGCCRPIGRRRASDRGTSFGPRGSSTRGISWPEAAADEGEVGAVGGILLQKSPPPVAHQPSLCVEAPATRAVVVEAAADRFVVVEDGSRFKDDAEARGAGPEAEVDVVVSHGEVLGVEAAQ